MFEGAQPLHQAPSGAAAAAAGGGYTAVPFFRFRFSENKDPRNSIGVRGSRRTAATYSPNWWVSTIGAGELNCSVRNGKRWILTAITTAVCYLREKDQSECLPAHWNHSQIFSLLSWLIFLLGKSLGPLVQVS